MKKLLRYFFELRFLPNLSSFLFDNEIWLRLRPIKIFLKIIDADKKKKIVDIGGATGRLELRLGRPDIYEEAVNIARKNFDNVIVGSGTQINCEDNSFDWSISIHTLEHIPKSERENFILEMIRVSKEGIFMNFPEGEYAEKLCHNFLGRLQERGLELNKWTREHLEKGLPTSEEINTIIEKQEKFHFKLKFIRNYNAENLYWTLIRTRKSRMFKYILSPFLSVYKYLKINSKPYVELILVGSKNEDILNMVIKEL